MGRNAEKPPLPAPIPVPTPAQQAVLDRIRVQRERLRARSAAQRQERAIARERSRIDPAAPLPQRLLAFGRLHPVATLAVAGLALASGPRRMLRWAGVLLPLLSRLRS
jgi:hypothetical protein